jgi:hypothetical protein
LTRITIIGNVRNMNQTETSRDFFISEIFSMRQCSGVGSLESYLQEKGPRGQGVEGARGNTII